MWESNYYKICYPSFGKTAAWKEMFIYYVLLILYAGENEKK